MRTLVRCLEDHRSLWRMWLPVLLLILFTAPLVFAQPLIEKQLIDGVLLTRQMDQLVPTVALYSGLWLLISVMQVAGATLRSYLGEQLTLQLRRRLFFHCQALSLAFSNRQHSGRTMTLFVNDVPALAGFLSTVTALTIGNAFALLVGAAVMFRLNWQLALVVGITPPLAAGLAALLTRPLRRLSRMAQEKAAELNERLQENLTGMRELVAFGQERIQGARFVTTMRELLRLRMRVTMVDTTIQAGQSVFSLAVMVAIFGFGGYLVITGRATLGTVIAVDRIFGQVYGPAVGIVAAITGLQKVLASADRIYEFLDERPQVEDSPDARPPEHIAGAVAFDHVSFAYAPDRPVLHDVTFSAGAGEMVALVGPSGAGKSTLAGLIARFYDPTEGEVLLDGVDLCDLTLEGLRHQIGMVFQDAFLFATTIRENVALGGEGATEAAIIGALRSANAWEFVEHLPQGLDTQVGERGVQFSEGQKQRLAIARALLRDPRILILDEPTAALDARSEHLLQSALDNLMSGRTTFVIAHRLATVQRADRILVLESGRIVEQGTHTELLQRHGLYRELFDLQFGERAVSAPEQPVETPGVARAHADLVVAAA